MASPKKEPTFATEADLVAAFVHALEGRHYLRSWQVYPETADFDLLLVQKDTGVQLGLEAKLSLNLKVVTQALPKWHRDSTGPDYRGVLVPHAEVQNGLETILPFLGIGIIRVGGHFDLPDEDRMTHYSSAWHPWLPTKRCVLPAYVPDVVGGKPAPLRLTAWKINAIKAIILLDRKGFVTRADLIFLGISPARWTAPDGFLRAESGVYVRCDRTPDFRREHPVNSQQIEDDFDAWKPNNMMRLFGDAAA